LVGFLVVFGFGFLIYMTVLLYGQMVLGAVVEEKETRIAEILFSSIRSFPLMMGKLVGVSLVALSQLSIWGLAFAALTLAAAARGHWNSFCLVGVLGLNVPVLSPDYNAGANRDRNAATLADSVVARNRNRDHRGPGLVGVAHLSDRHVDDRQKGDDFRSLALGKTGLGDFRLPICDCPIPHAN